MEVAAGVYARISLDRTGAGLGVERQVEDCRELARARGWRVTEVYPDNDLSAFSGKRRPQYERMLGDAREGKIGAIVCWHVDRLTRQPAELEDVIRLADSHGLALATVTGEVDLGTPTGRLTARLIGATARYESEHKATRQRRQIEQAARAGRPHGGPRPFGFQADRVRHDPAEAEAVRHVATRLLDGVPLIRCCAELTAAGVLTPAGNQWTVTTLKRMILSPRVAGFRQYGAGVTFPAAWEPILDVEQWERLRAQLSSRRRGPSSSYLLTRGLATCALCGHPLHAWPDRGTRAYLCAARYRQAGRTDHADSCGKVRILADLLEEETAARVLARFASPDGRERLAGMLSAPAAPGLLAELAAARQRVQDVAQAWGDGDITRAEMLTARDAALTRVAAGERRLAGLSTGLGDVDPSDLAGWWARSPLARRVALLRVVVEHVTVGQSLKRGRHSGDADRIRILWRSS